MVEANAARKTDMPDPSGPASILRDAKGKARAEAPLENTTGSRQPSVGRALRARPIATNATKGTTNASLPRVAVQHDISAKKALNNVRQESISKICISLYHVIFIISRSTSVLILNLAEAGPSVNRQQLAETCEFAC